MRKYYYDLGFIELVIIKKGDYMSTEMKTNINSKNKIKNWIKSIISLQESSIFLSLIILAIFLSLASPYFFSFENSINILRQVSVVGIIAVGMAMVIITAGIDLSVGSVLSLGGVVTALLAQVINPWLAVILGLCIGALAGLINGILIVKVKITPFIVTLGMMSIAKGAAYLLTGGLVTRFYNQATFLGGGYIWRIPFSVIILISTIIIGQIITRKTVFGRNIYAVGSNEKAARLSGIKVGNVKVLVYTITGALAALAGIITAGNLTVADTASGSGTELDVIAAVVIGGTSMTGGKGTIVGVLLGSILMGMIRNGFVLLGVSAYWQVVTIGIIIILAVTVDSLRNKG